MRGENSLLHTLHYTEQTQLSLLHCTELLHTDSTQGINASQLLYLPTSFPCLNMSAVPQPVNLACVHSKKPTLPFRSRCGGWRSREDCGIRSDTVVLRTSMTFPFSTSLAVTGTRSSWLPTGHVHNSLMLRPKEHPIPYGPWSKSVPILWYRVPFEMLFLYSSVMTSPNHSVCLSLPKASK